MLWTLDKVSNLILIAFASCFLSKVLCCVGLASGCCTFITLLTVGGLLYLAFSMQRVSSNGKAVLITGCDSGFGYGLALRLDSKGFRVFACCLLAGKEGEGAKSLKAKGSKKLHVLQMDVTSEEEVQKAKKIVEDLLPNDECLWAIVNNAGISTYGHVEWVPISTYKRIAEVNLFGMVRVTKAFLPLIRKSKGRVVNVASMLGRMAAAMRSPYVATKYAVEGFSDSLRYEMKSYGVSVAIIEPGNFVAGTGIFNPESVKKQGEEMWNSMDEEVKNFYGEEAFRKQVDIMGAFITNGNPDITPAVDVFEEAVTQKYPQIRYQAVDSYYKLKVLSATHLPEWLYDLFYVGSFTK